MEKGKGGEKREGRGDKGVICSQGIRGKERSNSTGVLEDWCKRKRDDLLVDREWGVLRLPRER